MSITDPDAKKSTLLASDTQEAVAAPSQKKTEKKPKKLQAVTPDTIAEYMTKYQMVYRKLLRTFIKPSRLPLTQYYVLDILSHSAIRMGDLSDLMDISRPNLTPLVEKMVTGSLVERIPDPNDRRVIYITLTEKGKELLESERENLIQNCNELLAALGKRERKRLSDSLNSLLEIAQKL